MKRKEEDTKKRTIEGESERKRKREGDKNERVEIRNQTPAVQSGCGSVGVGVRCVCVCLASLAQMPGCLDKGRKERKTVGLRKVSRPNYYVLAQ